MKDFLLLTQSFQKAFLSGVVKNRKCMAKQIVNLDFQNAEFSA